MYQEFYTTHKLYPFTKLSKLRTSWNKIRLTDRVLSAVITFVTVKNRAGCGLKVTYGVLVTETCVYGSV